MHNSTMRITPITEIEAQYGEDGAHILNFLESASSADGKYVQSYLALYMDETQARRLKRHIDHLIDTIERSQQ